MSNESTPPSPADAAAEPTRCGLCGKDDKLTRTPCCGHWICDDADQYVPFSYARNSCFTNHAKYTICSAHHHAGHAGRWQDCAQCRGNQPLELFVHYATNEFNFEKLANPPEFEPTHCVGCSVVIRLSQDEYLYDADGFRCGACGGTKSGRLMRQIVDPSAPPAAVPSGMEQVPVRIVGRRGRYPLASLAYYGPDNTRATKLVVSVLRNAREEDGPLHRWLTQIGDIREDTAITAEVEAFLNKHGVKQRIITDRIIGCAHEEGKDYPTGGVCPHCPFWHDRDRFTHERLPPPPSFTPAHILAELAGATNRQPREAILAADAHREALVEPLLRAIERGVADPAGMPESEAMLFGFAAYLLARWREPRAYPAFIRWLSLPGQGALDIGSDMALQDGARFLALLCGGDVQPIKTLILDRAANEFCRGQGVDALALLAAWGELPHEEVADYFTWLAREGLEREPSFVWSSLLAASAEIEALGAFPELRRAWTDGLIATGFISVDDLNAVENSPRGVTLAKYRDRHPPTMDVVQDTSWWGCFRDDPVLTHSSERSRKSLDEPLPSSRPEPFRAPPRVGRNDPCPCGSGRKFKKCCGR